jgi:hypothetical protein
MEFTISGHSLCIYLLCLTELFLPEYQYVVGPIEFLSFLSFITLFSLETISFYQKSYVYDIGSNMIEKRPKNVLRLHVAIKEKLARLLKIYHFIFCCAIFAIDPYHIYITVFSRGYSWIRCCAGSLSQR